jgi:hypothetical protein
MITKTTVILQPRIIPLQQTPQMVTVPLIPTTSLLTILRLQIALHLTLLYSILQ